MIDVVRRFPVLAFVLVVLTVPPVFGWAGHHGHVPRQFFEFAFFGLLGAAFLFAGITNGRSGVAALARSASRWRVSWGWWVFALVYFPGVALFAAHLYGVLMGQTVTYDWYDIVELDPWQFTIIVLVSLADEVAWFGLTFRRLADRIRPFYASLLVGVFWACWYIPRLSYSDMVADASIPLPLFFLNFVAMAPLCAWVYKNTKSGLLLVLMQVIANYSFLVVPVLPQAALNWHVFAFKVLGMALTSVFIALFFGRDLRSPANAAFAQSTQDKATNIK